MDHPGREERDRSRSLIAALAEQHPSLLRHRGADLAAGAEHVLYTALRQPEARLAPTAPRALVLSMGRPAGAYASARRLESVGRRDTMVALISSPAHARLFGPISDALSERGHPRPIIVAARTGGAGEGDISAVSDADLRAYLAASAVPWLTAYGTAVSVTLRAPTPAWVELLGRQSAGRLTAVLRSALPRLALDLERLRGLMARIQPPLVACFSESGLLARLAPAAAATMVDRPPVVDLPHAEAADPWGSVGVGYDGVAVYGPRARSVMLAAGVSEAQITEIGPLAADAMLAREPASPDVDRIRVVFASQPVKGDDPTLQAESKQAALRAALSLASALGAAELTVVPHPTENIEALGSLVAAIDPANGGTVRLERAQRLQEVLPGAWALVTISSQSAFEAVLAGIPAVTVNPTSRPDPVTFARDGIAVGIRTVDEGAALGARLRDPAVRHEAVTTARAALGDRLGPLDGRASERAAAWLARMARGGAADR